MKLMISIYVQRVNNVMVNNVDESNSIKISQKM